MSLPLFLARRIYSDQGDHHKKVSRPAISIATAGVAIGLAVMIITVAVVLGFKHTIRDKAIGFGCHIQVVNFLAANSHEAQSVMVDDSLMHTLQAIEGVSHVQRTDQTQAILKTDDDFLGVMLKGVGPEYDLNFLRQNMTEGEIPTFSDKQSSNKLVVSQLMADKLNVKNGDRIFAYFVGDEGVRTRRFTICGIYQTNMTRFDETVCLTDLYTVAKLNGQKPDMYYGVEVLTKDFDQLDAVAERFIEKVNKTHDKYGNVYTSQTIQETYPQIFNWLELLDINVWIILGLMICLSGITMISGLLIIILERTSMIGVLKALGARNRTIRHTFLWFAAFIISQGLLIGDAIGIGLVLLQKYTGIIKLDPQTYYVSEAPVEINLPLILLLNLATLLISIVVLIAPSFFISYIHPAKSMRYE
jgi:lipoprotein-releasing system permease protein